MHKHKWFCPGVVAIILIVLLALPACNLPWQNTGSAPPPTTPNVGDYGDAPDGSKGMDTGYYGFVGGPFVFTLQSMGVRSQFPTVRDAPIPGPYTLNVTEFYIGPLFGGDFDNNIPSVEDDATDVGDPDGIPNITPQSGMDCDKESGSHNPAGNNCAPTPAFSMPMNGRLVIIFGYPPLGLFTTSIAASPNLSVTGPAYWNFLIDLNQDGEWGSGEWVAQDVPVTLTPGQSTFVSSGAFKFPTSGTPWGRLKFPLWARSMVTLDRVKDHFPDRWDGRGIPGGFSHGEVEDYFLEWKPVGPLPPQPGGEDKTREPETPGETVCLPENVTTITCPETITENGEYTCGFSGPPPVAIEADCIGIIDTELTELGLSGEGLFGRIDLNAHPSGSLCEAGSGFDISYQMDTDEMSLRVSQLPEDAIITLYVDLTDTDTCYGSGPVGVTSGYMMRSLHADGDLSGTYIIGPFIVTYDPKGHVKYIGLINPIHANVFFDSIHIEGPAPWVNVSGDFNEADGSFSAKGRGTVAGFPDIAVTFEGTLTTDGISGDYTMGAEGGLPGGEPIIYHVEGSKVVEPGGEMPPTLPTGVQEAVEDFVQVFNTAFQDGDPEVLAQLLHPAVFERYGTEACQTYLEGVVGNTVQLETVEVSKVGTWNWETDGLSVPLDFIYKVEVNFTAQGQTSAQEIHLSLPGDDSVRWFTDCGEPLTQ